MTIEQTIKELYAFFNIEPVDDIREFNGLELERSYIKKLNTETIPKLKDDIKDKYLRLSKYVKELVDNYKPDNKYDMKTYFDEFCESIKIKPEPICKDYQ